MGRTEVYCKFIAVRPSFVRNIRARQEIDDVNNCYKALASAELRTDAINNGVIVNLMAIPRIVNREEIDIRYEHRVPACVDVTVCERAGCVCREEVG